MRGWADNEKVQTYDSVRDFTHLKTEMINATISSTREV
jgi:hypothetical protein